jgi:octaprenyl-diphosphate synthase
MGSASRARVEALFANPEPSDEQIAEVIAIVQQHGGIEYARRRADQFTREAEEALVSLPDTPARTALLDGIAYVVERRW